MPFGAVGCVSYGARCGGGGNDLWFVWCISLGVGAKRGWLGVGCLFATSTSRLKLWNNGCCGGEILPGGWVDGLVFCQVSSG